MRTTEERCPLTLAAADIHDKSGRPTDYPDPRGVALSWGIRVVPASRLPRRGITDGSTILYKPTLDERLRGLIIWHEFAHCYLQRHYPDTTEADAWILTGAAILRHRACLIPSETLVVLQKHAPEWFIDARKGYILWMTPVPWAAE